MTLPIRIVVNIYPKNNRYELIKLYNFSQELNWVLYKYMLISTHLKYLTTQFYSFLTFC